MTTTEGFCIMNVQKSQNMNVEYIEKKTDIKELNNKKELQSFYKWVNTLPPVAQELIADFSSDFNESDIYQEIKRNPEKQNQLKSILILNGKLKLKQVEKVFNFWGLNYDQITETKLKNNTRLS